MRATKPRAAAAPTTPVHATPWHLYVLSLVCACSCVGWCVSVSVRSCLLCVRVHARSKKQIADLSVPVAKTVCLTPKSHSVARLDRNSAPFHSIPSLPILHEDDGGSNKTCCETERPTKIDKIRAFCGRLSTPSFWATAAALQHTEGQSALPEACVDACAPPRSRRSPRRAGTGGSWSRHNAEG